METIPIHPRSKEEVKASEQMAKALQAIEDLKFWRKAGNKNIQNKITDLINSIQADPFKGLGKPEALKYELAGKWSRRINQ